MNGRKIRKGLVIGSTVIALATLLSWDSHASKMESQNSNDYPFVGVILPDRVISIDISEYIDKEIDNPLIDYGSLHGILLDQASYNVEMEEPSFSLIDGDNRRYALKRGQIGVSIAIDRTMDNIKEMISHGLSGGMMVDYRVIPTYEYAYPDKDIGYYDFIEDNVISKFSIFPGQDTWSQNLFKRI